MAQASRRPIDVTNPQRVQEATGRAQEEWFAILDGYGAMDHKQRAARLASEHPDLPGWWVQNLSVDYERARGLRVRGQTHKGDFQVSCSKTLPVPLDAAWQRLLATPFLPGATWRPGASWDAEGARVEVRRADSGVLRWFWFDTHGKSRVTVSMQDKGTKTALTFTHDGLPSAQAIEMYRARWKQALEQIARS